MSNPSVLILDPRGNVADSGVLAGFPLLDYKVQILDGLHHDVDSSPLANCPAPPLCFLCVYSSLEDEVIVSL